MIFTVLKTKKHAALEVLTTTGDVVLIPCLTDKEDKEFRDQVAKERLEAMSPDEKEAAKREETRAKNLAARAKKEAP